MYTADNFLKSWLRLSKPALFLILSLGVLYAPPALADVKGKLTDFQLFSCTSKQCYRVTVENVEQGKLMNLFAFGSAKVEIFDDPNGSRHSAPSRVLFAEDGLYDLTANDLILRGLTAADYTDMVIDFSNDRVDTY